MPPIHPSIGRIVAQGYEHEEDPGEYPILTELEVSSCSEERLESINEYWKTRLPDHLWRYFKEIV